MYKWIFFFPLRAAPPIFHVCLSIALWSCKLVRQRFHGWIQPSVLCFSLKNSLCNIFPLPGELFRVLKKKKIFGVSASSWWKFLVLLESINIINGLLLET